MCLASINAEHTRDANPGDTVRVRKGWDSQPYFHTEGEPDDQVTCIKQGSHVVVTGLSLQTARDLDIESEFEGIFAQDPHDISDAIWLGDNHFICLKELTQRDEVPSLYYSGRMSDDREDEFRSACDCYFSGKRMSVATDWSYPPMPTDSVVVVERLPAAVLPDGTTLDPETLSEDVVPVEPRRVLEEV